MPPWSTATAGPSKVTSESGRTITFEPEALIFAMESGLVCTRSPGKIAEEPGMVPPLSQAVPFVYSIAAPEELAANSDNGATASVKQQSIVQHRILRHRILRSIVVPFL